MNIETESFLSFPYNFDYFYKPQNTDLLKLNEVFTSPIFRCIWQGSPLIYKNVIMCTFQSFALLIHYLMEISPKHDIVPIHSFKLLSNISWRNHNSAAYPFKYDRDL